MNCPTPEGLRNADLATEPRLIYAVQELRGATRSLNRGKHFVSQDEAPRGSDTKVNPHVAGVPGDNSQRPKCEDEKTLVPCH